ncbi:MAG TPA: hypothetical protein VF570_12575 [Pyrinomonadaceae bacterium]|jgi:hypothetical protein
MIRSPNADGRAGRGEVAGDEGVAGGEESGTFDRSFKYAVIIYAVVEFFAIALLLYYKLAR